MISFKKYLINFFKIFFYKIFSIFYGKINGKILASEDNRIKTDIVIKQKEINYKVFRIRGGRLYTDRVHDTALILDNSIIQGPSHQLRPINNVEVEKNIVFEKGTPRIKKKLNGVVLSLLTGGAGNNNYSHWLLDVLPRLSLCEQVINLSDINFILLPNLEKKFQKETLQMLNIKNDCLISSKTFRHIQATEIIVTDHPYCITGNATKDIMNIPNWIPFWLKQKFLNKEKKINKYPEKIYIDRSDSESNTKHLRQIINEKEVVDLLLNNGFKSISLSRLHFKDQVQLFNDARIIVGLHGAGFTNVCFCEQGAKIIELKSKSAGIQYKNLSEKNKLNYSSISCQPSKFDQNNQYGHIEVPINELKQLISD